MRQKKLLSDKVILITGASKGIGRAVALECAANGGHVIITGRTLSDLEKLDDEINKINGKSTIVELDQLDYPAFPRLSLSIFERWGRLDGFVANAAQLGQLAPMSHIDEKVWNETIDVNLNSIWYQIKVFESILKKSRNGRAVLITSGAAVGSRPFWGPYAVSKAGLEALGRAWAAENEKTNLKINLFDPGGTATQMRATAFPGEDPKTLPTSKEVAKSLIFLLTNKCVSQGTLFKSRELKKIS